MLPSLFLKLFFKVFIYRGFWFYYMYIRGSTAIIFFLRFFLFSFCLPWSHQTNVPRILALLGKNGLATDIWLDRRQIFFYSRDILTSYIIHFSLIYFLFDIRQSLLQCIISSKAFDALKLLTLNPNTKPFNSPERLNEVSVHPNIRILSDNLEGKTVENLRPKLPLVRFAFFTLF